MSAQGSRNQASNKGRTTSNKGRTASGKRHGKRKQRDKDTPGSDSDSSLYSLSDLSDDNDHRRLRADDVDRQAHQAPSKKLTVLGPNDKVIDCTYPKPFLGRDDTLDPERDIPADRPWNEYPIASGKGKNYPGHGDPGPARIIYNLDPENRDRYGVTYHSPPLTAINGYRNDMKPAKYREGKTKDDK